MIHRRVVFYVLIAALLSTPLFASNEASHQEKINLLKQEVKSIKAELVKQQRSKSKTNKELIQYDKEISVLSSQLRTAIAAITENEKSLKELQQNKKRLNKSIAKNKTSLAQLIRTFHMLGDQNNFKAMFNSEDPGKHVRAQVYFEYLSSAYQEKYTQLDNKLLQLSDLSKILEEKQGNQQLLLANLNREKTSLQQKQKQKKDYVKSLDNQIKSKKKRISLLKKDRETLEKLAKAIAKRKQQSRQSKSTGMAFAAKKRTLKWPVDGKVKNKFGRSRVGSQLKWRGVLIATESGAEVRAVEKGQVVFADWLSGYGFVLIVDHNDDYMSLYGHNRQLLKDVGDSVGKDELVAEAGNSGRGGEPALYFEIRHQGKPVNPAKWILAKKSRRK